MNVAIWIIVCLFILVSLRPLIVLVAKRIKYNNTADDAHKIAEAARQEQISQPESVNEPEADSKDDPEDDSEADSEDRFYPLTWLYLCDEIKEDDLPYTESLYDSGIGYGGEKISFHTKKKQFYCHDYIWHIDDSMEVRSTTPVTAEEAVAVIEQTVCSESKKKSAVRALKRIEQLSGIDVSESIRKVQEMFT